jgi:hypothetical protein
MDGNAFELLRNATNARPFKQHGDRQPAARVAPDGRADHALNGHKPLGVPFLDFYDTFKSLLAVALGQQDTGEGQDCASANSHYDRFTKKSSQHDLTPYLLEKSIVLLNDFHAVLPKKVCICTY